MYQAHLTVLKILGTWTVSGVIKQYEEDSGWSPVAMFSDLVPLPVSWDSEDEAATIIEVIRQWSEMTSQT